MGSITNLQPVPRVVDLSHYDNVKDKFKGAVGFGIWGVINKVTENIDDHDESFSWRQQPAHAAGLLYGAYHFLHTGNAEQQADWFLQHVGSDASLLLALDHEQHATADEVKTWLQYVHDKTGRWPWLYSGFLIKEQLAGKPADPFWKNINLWLSQYSRNPNWPDAFDTPPLIQYTGDGMGPTPHNVPGIVCGAGIDINHFAGTREELETIWTT